MIYVMQAGDERLFKIGYTKDAETARKRVSTLGTAQSQKLSILALVDGERPDEKALHRLLADYKVRGEWFSDESAPGYYNLLDNVIELVERYGVQFVLDQYPEALAEFRPIVSSKAVFWRLDVGTLGI